MDAAVHWQWVLEVATLLIAIATFASACAAVAGAPFASRSRRAWFGHPRPIMTATGFVTTRYQLLLHASLVTFFSLGLARAVHAITITISDAAALSALSAAWTSSNSSASLTNWGTEQEPCTSWAGVSCSTGGNVTRIMLYNAGLNGPLPTLLGLFAALTSLNVSKNSLTGRIPTDLFNLAALQSFDVSHNAGLWYPTGGGKQLRMKCLHSPSESTSFAATLY